MATIPQLSPHFQPPSLSPAPHITSDEVLSRKRRMNFFDLANLLDSDGNMQNEMLVFAFAATMLSTIPVLLGNEFDVNVGLKRKKREDINEENSKIYQNFENSALDKYKYLMTKTTPANSNLVNGREPDLFEMLRNVVKWSGEKTKKYGLLSSLLHIGIEKYKGTKTPADKFVSAVYKKWKSL